MSFVTRTMRRLGTFVRAMNASFGHPIAQELAGGHARNIATATGVVRW